MSPASSGHATLAPAWTALGVHPAARRQFDVDQYTVRGDPLPDAGGIDMLPQVSLTVVACASDQVILEANLLASPCFQTGSPHEWLITERPPSVADALNAAMRQARHGIVVLAHQDVYLPAGWDRRFAARWAEAEAAFGPFGVAGVYGTAPWCRAYVRAGHVAARDSLLQPTQPLPARADAFGRVAAGGAARHPAAVRRVPGVPPLRDRRLPPGVGGWPAVVRDAVCFHNSLIYQVPPAFAASARVLAREWPDRLPLATPCAVITPSGLEPPPAGP